MQHGSALSSQTNWTLLNDINVTIRACDSEINCKRQLLVLIVFKGNGINTVVCGANVCGQLILRLIISACSKTFQAHDQTKQQREHGFTVPENANS